MLASLKSLSRRLLSFFRRDNIRRSKAKSNETFIKTFDHNLLSKELIDDLLKSFHSSDKLSERQVIYLDPKVRRHNPLALSEVGSVIPLHKLPYLSAEVDKNISLYVQQVVLDYIKRHRGLFATNIEVKDTAYLICEWNYASNAWISPFVLKRDATRLISIIIPLAFPIDAGIQFKHFGFVPFKKAGSAIAFPAFFTHEFAFVNRVSSSSKRQPIYCLETHIEFLTSMR